MTAIGTSPTIRCADLRFAIAPKAASPDTPSTSCRRGASRPSLIVEPDVFHAPAIVLAVDHDGQVFDLRLHAGGGTGVVDDRARAVLLQPLVDVPDEMPAPVAVGYLGLRDKPFLELGIAVGGIVALRAAAVILEELLVGVVDAAAGVVETDLVVLAGELGEPVGGLDRVELAVDPDLFELVDQDDRRIAIARDIARGDFGGEPLVWPLA
jgi:hypothetical protein